MATNHFLNLCRSSSLTHICGTRGRWVITTSADALWHVRHFVIMHIIRPVLGPIYPAVIHSYCYSNQCFSCECYLNLYWSRNYHCMWQTRIVICMVMNLIWLHALCIGALAGALMIKLGTKSLHQQIEPNWCRQLNAIINNKFRSFRHPLITDRRET